MSMLSFVVKPDMTFRSQQFEELYFCSFSTLINCQVVDVPDSLWEEAVKQPAYSAADVPVLVGCAVR